ncbi:TRAP transporter fused permease subunit [Pararhodobacter sp.]|uniref:TRAP transporter fused permease subunit n=1 Tax=Pararhodobacter sp. TaxID=2127056 RepID=UPI002AFEBCF5|nr:TRAP transporter fused permease subunit [Pararhodobacter sp.]
MADPTESTSKSSSDLGLKLAYVLGLILVVIGMLNTLPAIPGLQGLVDSITGVEGLTFRRFPYEYLFPLSFVIMMATVALNHSLWRASAKSGAVRRGFGLFLDVALVVMAITMALSYLIEIDSVCLIDRLNGSRAEMIAAALQDEIAFAEMMGLPAPTSVDDPSCVTNLGVWIFLAIGLAVTVFLAYNVYVWGLPLVMVAIIIAAYTMLTIAIWYFYGADDMNRYWVTILGGEPRQLIDGRPNVEDILVNSAQGLLGRFMGILLNTVFPYIVLGSLFGVSAGGKSLIKMSFILTRRLRGGPAHAAIISSALFGTISGGPVVNVLSTGVLTIPMMLKRGFNRVFAGGVEAAASSGGQIMPPVMGVAAFVLATMTAVPYSQVIIAALIPAAAYFGALFVTVVFQARKQGIEAQGELPADMKLTRLDYLHLVMIFVPILLILFLLITPKEAIGCGPITDFFGAVSIETADGCRNESLPWFFQVVQNSAGDSGSAGWWAAAVLMVLFFLDKEIRQHPRKLLDALADAGILVSTLYLMFLAVSVIDFCLNLTGLSAYIARDVTFALNDFGGAIGENGLFLFVALVAAMLLAILLGMGMPTVPAYLNVALLLGPLLSGLGISIFTAHMFVFYFAVASAITPPVAVAAFAAASITRADPMMTGFSAVRSGIVMFVIPFIFAFYPELLLIDAAQLVPGSTSEYLPGYDGTIDWLSLGWLAARLSLALYLLGSVLAGFDFKRLGLAESIARLAAALLLVMAWPMIYGAGIVLTVLIFLLHTRAARAVTA